MRVNGESVADWFSEHNPHGGGTPSLCRELLCEQDSYALVHCQANAFRGAD